MPLEGDVGESGLQIYKQCSQCGTYNVGSATMAFLNAAARCPEVLKYGVTLGQRAKLQDNSIILVLQCWKHPTFCPPKKDMWRGSSLWPQDVPVDAGDAFSSSERPGTSEGACCGKGLPLEMMENLYVFICFYAKAPSKTPKKESKSDGDYATLDMVLIEIFRLAPSMTFAVPNFGPQKHPLQSTFQLLTEVGLFIWSVSSKLCATLGELQTPVLHLMFLPTSIFSKASERQVFSFGWPQNQKFVLRELRWNQKFEPMLGFPLRLPCFTHSIHDLTSLPGTISYLWMTHTETWFLNIWSHRTLRRRGMMKLVLGPATEDPKVAIRVDVLQHCGWLYQECASGRNTNTD